MFYLLIATFLWGTSFIAGKIAYQMADPALVVLFRLILAMLLMLPITVAFLKKTSVDRATLRQLILLGLLTYPITFLLQFEGLKLTSASSAATMIGLEPLMVAVVGQMFFKEIITAKVWFLSFLAFIGVFLVAGVSGSSDISLIGCLLVLSSTVVVAFWLRLSKKILQTMDTKFYTAITIQLGTLFGLPLILMATDNWNINFSISGTLAVIYLGVACSIVAAWLWNKGLSTTSASHSGIFVAFEPVWGVLLAVVYLREQISITTLIGIILVITSAALAMLSDKQKN